MIQSTAALDESKNDIRGVHDVAAGKVEAMLRDEVVAMSDQLAC
jgi:hypothetical protein